MKAAIGILITLLLLMACQESSTQELKAPNSLNDGWLVAYPTKEGFNQQKLEAILRTVNNKNPKMDALVIAKNGKLLVDRYFNGYTEDKLHRIWSITKMLSGTLVGIAQDKQLLNIQDSIYKYLGTYSSMVDPSKKEITIEHLITMTSGIDWVELGGEKSPNFNLPYSNDWIKFVLQQPKSILAGKQYNYSSGNTVLLAPILESSSQQQAEKFAKEFLFKPLAITNYQWDKQSEFWTRTQNGELGGAKIPKSIDYQPEFALLTNTATGLHMLPRDLCKIGQLYLNKGKWGKQQLLSKNWVKESTQGHFGNNNYGYHWRLGEVAGHRCYYATGFGLQRLYIFPQLDMVVVFVQNHYRTMSQGDQLSITLLKDLLNSLEK